MLLHERDWRQKTAFQVTSRREAKRLALSLFWNVRAEFSRRAPGHPARDLWLHRQDTPDAVCVIRSSAYHAP